MKRLSEALASLDLAVDQLEDTVAGQLAANRSQRKPPRALKGDDMNSLFSDGQLSSVKQRLDDAIERLESALESADVAR
jgi:hypothetical protein